MNNKSFHSDKAYFVDLFVRASNTPAIKMYEKVIVQQIFVLNNTIPFLFSFQIISHECNLRCMGLLLFRFCFLCFEITNFLNI